MNKAFDIEGLGKVIITKNRQAKHIRITVRADASVRVTLPAGTGYNQGLYFVKKKLPWIKKSILKIQEKPAVPSLRFPGRNKLTPLHELVLEKTTGTTLTGQINGEAVIIGVPEGFTPDHAEVSAFIRFMTEKVLRLEAGSYLQGRVSQLAGEYGFQYGRITLRNMTSRWGSCSAANNISLNIHLMRLPEHLRDYVILHELVHTHEKNHGPAFWELLNRLTHNRAKALQKEMRNYSTLNY
ncbi:MAG: M48 family metallopeptidase [Chlorobi bacterium]|nr:M48 family metallopeptidase [Chlorobiota bacterium]